MSPIQVKVARAGARGLAPVLEGPAGMRKRHQSATGSDSLTCGTGYLVNPGAQREGPPAVADPHRLLAAGAVSESFCNRDAGMVAWLDLRPHLRHADHLVGVIGHQRSRPPGQALAAE